jgi:hypothetical protein
MLPLSETKSSGYAVLGNVGDSQISNNVLQASGKSGRVCRHGDESWCTPGQTREAAIVGAATAGRGHQTINIQHVRCPVDFKHAPR